MRVKKIVKKSAKIVSVKKFIQKAKKSQAACACVKARSAPANGTSVSAAGAITGSYAFDRSLGRVVKISADIPGVASHGDGCAMDSEGVGCSAQDGGQGGCGGGACPMPDAY